MEYPDSLSLPENLIDKIFVLASLKLSSVIKKKMESLGWDLPHHYIASDLRQIPYNSEPLFPHLRVWEL